jgi:multimeric flavodoxin WrbA
MKAIGVVGSPRKNGNVDTLVNAALEGAKGAGMETQLFRLGDMRLQGCVACRRCKMDGICRYDDDLWKVLTAMQEADGVVLGAPIYYWQLSSQMRTLLDRTYAFLKPDYSTRWKPGKRIVFITSQGFTEASAYVGVHKELTSIFGQYAGFEVVGDITMTGGDDPSAARSRKDMMDAARRAGELMAGK